MRPMSKFMAVSIATLINHIFCSSAWLVLLQQRNYYRINFLIYVEDSLKKKFNTVSYSELPF